MRRVVTNDIRILSDVSGVAAALGEAGAREVGRTYAVNPIDVPGGCFHPKFVLLDGEAGPRLVIGSGNLTFGGWGRNLELYEVLAPAHSPAAFNDAGVILAGHGRVEAAKLAGLLTVPVVRISHLSDVEQRAYMLADNKLAQLAGYNEDLLAEELQDLVSLNWDIDLTGFSTVETDLIVDAAQARKADPKLDEDDIVPETSLVPVSKLGDVWYLGPHEVVWGDSRSGDTYKGFSDERPYDLMFADVPYNVPIQGNVCGSGKVKHREFAMASGEMSPLEYTTFLAVTLSIAALHLRDGAISFVCIDWRHYKELIEAGQIAFEEYKQLCV